MALSNPNTPRSHLHPKNYHTPKSYLTPKRLCRPATETPECFSNVTVETPGTLKRRNSNSNCKEKCHKISNLTVAVRIRPMNLRELSFVGVYDATQVNGKNLVIRTNLTGNLLTFYLYNTSIAEILTLVEFLIVKPSSEARQRLFV